MADYVTRLQNEVNGMCSLFFNFAGALQRDAPKASVGGEPVPKDTDFNVEEQSKLMANQLMEASKEIDRIISKLPPLDRSTLDRQTKIVEMWKEKVALEEALKDEAEELEMVMSELREVHGSMVADIVAENAEPSESEADSDDSRRSSSSSEGGVKDDNAGDGDDYKNDKDDGVDQSNANESEQGGGPTTDASAKQEDGPMTSGVDEFPDANGGPLTDRVDGCNGGKQSQEAEYGEVECGHGPSGGSATKRVREGCGRDCEGWLGGKKGEHSVSGSDKKKIKLVGGGQGGGAPTVLSFSEEDGGERCDEFVEGRPGGAPPRGSPKFEWSNPPSSIECGRSGGDGYHSSSVDLLDQPIPRFVEPAHRGCI